ncbi:E3 ubiquitin-protein ligase Topors-like [Portunus trituberculatus]|uniref:E3 ubiquitin-protein ligase Topors-like n=1 Tax=Portunus trituberculatus TaxID=210409 RepID=UPI001E1CD576|nr:E3 ubiquitin-protein ligase Topors-like [Portunus trituberculatus]
MPSPREEQDHGDDTSSGKRLDSSKPGSENKNSQGSPPRSPASTTSLISDDTCPICLGNITDKCMANSCQHCFCLVCLKEWSKQKAVCPLCKERFTKIIYDIKSDKEFKEWKVPRSEPYVPLTNIDSFLFPDRRFFGYRTTNFPGAATLRRQHPGSTAPIADAIPSGPRERSSASYNMRGSSFFRLNIYLNNEWVQPIADITGRYRQSSPQLYREQPALTHRLVPWVNRELAALLHSARIGIVLTEVMDLIERYPINSREFRRAVRPHLGSRTRHFVHEFYNFARSPYDMVGHDNAAHYVTRYGFDDESSSDSSSSEDSDAVVEVDVQGNPVTSTTSRAQQSSAVAPDTVEREEILTQEGSVLISSDESSSNEIPQQSNLFMQSRFSENHNPEPPVSSSYMMNQLVGRARSFLNSINEGASTSVAEDATIRSNARKKLKREIPSDSDDSDACMIVEEVNKRQRTPEIITLDSEEEKSMPSLPIRGKHFEDKYGHDSRNDDRTSQQERKGKRKPSLNRTNFPIPLSQSNATASSRMSNRDHSYCNVQEVAAFTCSVRQRIDQSSSSDGNYNIIKTVQKGTHKRFIISSDSESSVERKKNRHKEKSKTRKTVGAHKNEEISRGDGCGSSSWHDTNSPIRKRRKDHKSKVKSSSQSHLWTSHKKHSSNHLCVSENSSNSWCNSDNVWTPPSTSTTERSSSRDDHDGQDGSSSECSSVAKKIHYKGKKGDHSNSKSKYFSKKGKHKKKDKHKEKSKKVKKGKHKKKCKSKRTNCSSSSDSDSVSDSSEERICRHKKKRRRIKESNSCRRVKCNEYCSSSD